MRPFALPAVLSLSLLAACGPSPEEQQAAAQARADAKVAPYVAEFDKARAAGDFVQAARLADLILHDAPNGTAAAQVNAVLVEVHAKAAEQAETQRLAGLWTYLTTLVEGQASPQRHASLYNQRAEGDTAAPRVQLVLRHDPRWGQSTYLVIEQGEFGCGTPCAFSIAAGEGTPQTMSGEKSSTGTYPALFIQDDKTFVSLLESGSPTRITAADGSGPTLQFDTGGFDPDRYARGR